MICRENIRAAILLKAFPFALCDSLEGSILFETYLKMLPRKHQSLEFISRLLCLAFLLSLSCQCWCEYKSKEYPTFFSWKTACDKLPSNRLLLGQTVGDKLPTALPEFKPVAEALNATFELFKTGTMNAESNWVGEKPNDNEFFNAQRAYFLRPPIPFQPFAQKLTAPAGSEIIFHGDFHGDIHSFITMLDSLNKAGTLDGFRLVKPNAYMVFLGDYTDRGNFGIEVLYTMLRLKLANPENVFMARGNHEDVQMIASYGFLAECQKKYARQFNPGLIARLYDFFPVVIYVGSGEDFIQCNHGGMEPGYLPGLLLDAKPKIAFQLLNDMKGGRFLKKYPKLLDVVDPVMESYIKANVRDYVPVSPMQPIINGFMWNDFTVFAEEPGLSYKSGRGFVYGKSGTRIVLDASAGSKSKVRGVFRAHQHSSGVNPMMRRLIAGKGVFRHWHESDSLAKANVSAAVLHADCKLEHGVNRKLKDGFVWTFNVAPDSYYGVGNAYKFDTYGILMTANKFVDWNLRVVNQIVPILKKLPVGR
ncbi:MAG: metallophosphoesterase family protein [Verrucomicrobiota bacterium]|nr:metallophosphoesterase family protein [Verrucomicrobiota bacterium]